MHIIKTTSPNPSKSFRSAVAMLCALTFFTVLLGGCQSRQVKPNEAHADKQTIKRPKHQTILISIDGLRHDALNQGVTPNLDAMAAEGVRTKALVPQFPTKTFPNHFSIVTGVVPSRHGLVNNTMFDDELGKYSLGNRKAVADGRWYQAEPIWVTAEKAGIRTATLFWPGSEAAINGIRPSQYKPFDDTMPPAARVEQVLAWLTQKDERRPHFLTLYFEHVDTESHIHGVSSPKSLQAISMVDEQIGRLRRSIEQLGLTDQVNLIVVSDHGMTPSSLDRLVVLDDLYEHDQIKPTIYGEVTGFEPLPGVTIDPNNLPIAPHPHFPCWHKSKVPARWQYSDHPRIPTIVCVVDDGYIAASESHLAKIQRGERHASKGAHGYRPELTDMHGVGFAIGPDMAENKQLPNTTSLHIHAVLLQLLGLDDPNDTGIQPEAARRWLKKP